jgi:pimeloyl-ACP methyl ester carboxylesterase
VPYFQTFDPQADAQAHAVIARTVERASIHDIVHQGVRVRWRRFGDHGGSAPPLVLLHGGHGNWMHWMRNIEALSEARALWLPDMPGYGDSGTPPEPAAQQKPIDPLLDVLAGSLDALIDPAAEIDLGGFSFGGFVAAQLAVRRGGIRRLALVGSGGHGTPRRPTEQMVKWRGAPDRETERAALLHNLGALMLHDKAAIDPLAFAIHDAACHATRFRSKEVSTSGGLQETLDHLGGPQLLLWGEHDVTAIPRPLVADLVARGQQREGAVIEGAGHWAQFERADAFNARVTRFLG